MALYRINFDELCPNIVNNHSRIVNIAVGVLMVLGGIAQFFPASMSTIIVGVYVIIFGTSKCSHRSAA